MRFFYLILLLAPLVAIAEDEQKFFIHADILSRDEEAGITKGIGNVEVAYGENVLSADEITMFEAENKIVAEGNVRLLDKSGSVTQGPSATLYDEGATMEVEEARVTLPEGSRIAARVLEKRSENQYVLHRGVFTPCAPCRLEEGKDKGTASRPIWQIRASRVVNDRKNQHLHYYNAVFEVMGVPVFYTPYHSHPDPTVKRRSGWLRPSFADNNLLGDTYYLHYYGVISPHADFEFRPFHTKRDGWVLRANARVRTMRGEVSLEGALANSFAKKPGQSEAKDQNRGYGKLGAKFDIDKNWRWGGEYSRASDDTFLRRYGIYGGRTARSSLFLEGFTARNYAKAELLSYQDFRINSTTTDLLPSLRYSFAGRPRYRIGSWNIDLDLTHFRHKEHIKPSVGRMVVRAVKNFISHDKSGLVFEFKQSIQANFYNIRDKTEGSEDENKFASEITPRFLSTVSYPLASVRRWGYFSLTPKVGFALGANHKPKKSIYNIDGNETEFDESDLFVVDRASGYDKAESGKRIDYGLSLGTLLDDGKGASGFFGQSYRLDKEPERDEDTAEAAGAGKGYSDFVGNFQIFPAQDLAFNYRYRLDKRDLDLRVSEISAVLGEDDLKATVSYLKLKLPYVYNRDDNEGKGIKYSRREEISPRLDFKFGAYWGGYIGGSYNMDTNRSVSYRARFGYSDECFAADIIFRRTFVRDRDYAAEDFILFQFNFKYVGPLQVR